MASADPEAAAKARAEAAAAKARADAILAAFDANKDGKLGDDELARLVAEFNDPQRREALPSDARDALHFYDRNKDAVLDHEELAELRSDVDIHASRLAGYSAVIARSARYLVRGVSVLQSRRW